MGNSDRFTRTGRSSGDDRRGGRRKGAAVPPFCLEADGEGAAAPGPAAGRISYGCEVDLSCAHRPLLGKPSQRTAEIGLRFGIPLFGSEVTIADSTTVTVAPGRIVLLLGPSGSGKSSVLAKIDGQLATACMVHRISFTPDAAVVDQIAPWATLPQALEMMTMCGFSEPHLWVRRFDELSDGEKFRAGLAKAIALHAKSGGAVPVLCDEFCTVLHRRLAKAISFNLRKLADQCGLSLVVASCHDDVVTDLRPHAIVRLESDGRCAVETSVNLRKRPISLRRRLRIEAGRKRDYQAFASMHYRATDELGFVDKVFLLRDGRDGDILGIIVYSHSPLELALRNRATGGRFSGNPRLVNERFRIIRRLVMHPDVRGCGLGHHLVAATLSRVGTEYIECLATMGAFNPVFEKAGMTRIGQYALCPKRQAALDELKALDIDPNGREFPLIVARRPRVRAIVSRVVQAWYAKTTGGGEKRVERQSPQFLAQTFRGLVGARPVYYLWHDDRAKKATQAA